jgi:hypothetical protein
MHVSSVLCQSIPIAVTLFVRMHWRFELCLPHTWTRRSNRFPQSCTHWWNPKEISHQFPTYW